MILFICTFKGIVADVRKESPQRARGIRKYKCQKSCINQFWIWSELAKARQLRANSAICIWDNKFVEAHSQSSGWSDGYHSLASGRQSLLVTNFFRGLNQTPVGLACGISGLLWLRSVPQMFSSLSWVQVMDGRVGLPPCCWRHRGAGRAAGGWAAGFSCWRWALEKVRGWTECLTGMKQALGWAISLWGLEREVSRLEGGDGDIGSGRGVKANWCDLGLAKEPLQPGSPSQLLEFPWGCRAVPESSKPIPVNLLWATAGAERLAPRIICSKNKRWSQCSHVAFPWESRKELPTGKGCSDVCLWSRKAAFTGD